MGVVANTLDFISQWGPMGFIRWTNNNQEDKMAGRVSLGPMGWNLNSNQTVVYSETRTEDNPMRPALSVIAGVLAATFHH